MDKQYDYSPIRLLGTVEEVVDLVDFSNAVASSGRYCVPISGDDIARATRKR